MLTLFYRAIIIYLLVFIVIRLSGKRQLSQLQPFDLVMTLLIADLASEPAADPNIPMYYGVVPIVAIFIMQKVIALIAIKSEAIRSLACGKPLMVISGGHVCEETMRKARYSVQDLLEHLRTMSVFNISEVQYAILETGGSLSVMLKGEFQTPTCGELNVGADEKGLSYALIIDGKIIGQALQESGLDEKTLMQRLKSVGITDVKHVLFAVQEDDGKTVIQTKAFCGGKTYTVDEAK